MKIKSTQRTKAALRFDRELLDEILFSALSAVYQLERSKIELFDLTYEEIYILQYLRRRREVRMGDIALELKIPMSTASRVVTRLQHRDLLTRNRDGNDKRNIIVTLRPGGKKLVKRVEDHTYTLISRNLAGKTPEEIKVFYSTAVALKDILKLD
jgi:MarR family transcriptional regulator, organic hydroperoxide resistance regulator